MQEVHSQKPEPPLSSQIAEPEDPRAYLLDEREEDHHHGPAAEDGREQPAVDPAEHTHGATGCRGGELNGDLCDTRRTSLRTAFGSDAGAHDERFERIDRMADDLSTHA